MFDAVVDFRLFGVIKAVQSPYQITGNAPNTLKIGLPIPFFSAALRTDVVDNAGVTAYRVPVHRMIDRTISNPGFLRTAHHLFKGFQIIGRIAVQFDIGNMSAIGEIMIRGLYFNLIPGGNIIIDRHMEGIRIIFAVSNTGDFTKPFRVHTDKAAG